MIDGIEPPETLSALGQLRRLHSAVAYTPATLLQVDQRDIEALLDGSHSLCRAFLRLETLRLGLLLTAIEQYSVQSLEARLASRLLEAGNGPKLSEELAEAMDTIFGASIPAYQGYFGLLGEEEAGSSQKRRELRRQMPIAVTR